MASIKSGTIGNGQVSRIGQMMLVLGGGEQRNAAAIARSVRNLWSLTPRDAAAGYREVRGTSARMR